MNTFQILIIRALYTGLFTGIVIAIPMGPAGIESVRWTLMKGFKSGVKVAAGSLIVDAIDVMLINFGLLNLINTNKNLEISFWIISGIIIFIIGYRAVMADKKSNVDKKAQVNEDDQKMHPVFRGFIINISNPMTHFFWLTLSSTVISIWRSAGNLPYFLFTVSMLTGMFISLYTINLLASKGKKFSTPKVSGNLNTILSYAILSIGVGFIANGLYKFYSYIK